MTTKVILYVCASYHAHIDAVYKPMTSREFMLRLIYIIHINYRLELNAETLHSASWKNNIVCIQTIFSSLELNLERDLWHTLHVTA